MLLEWLLIGTWCLVVTPVSLVAWRKMRGLDGVLFGLCFLLAQGCAPLTLMWISPDNSVANVYRVRGVMSASEAKELIDESEAYASSQGGWATARHAHYPTTDVAVNSLANGERVAEMIRERVYPILSKEYGVTNLILRDLFVVKYEGSSQRGLRRHRDGCRISFGIALTPPSEGGTYFASFRHLLHNVQIGELWTHPSGLLHRAKPVSENEFRYVLVGFVNAAAGGAIWRTWGASATTLRIFHRGDDAFSATDDRATTNLPSLYTWTLAKRSLRKLRRELLNSSVAGGKMLVYTAFFLFVALTIVLSMCCYDICCAFNQYLREEDDDSEHDDVEWPSPTLRLSMDHETTRGRYADEQTTTMTTGARRRAR